MSNYPEAPGYPPTPESEARTAALKRIEAKRGLVSHVVVYLVVNTFLVGIWWFTTGGGYFWPGWVSLASVMGPRDCQQHGTTWWC